MIDIDPRVDFVFKWLFGSEANVRLLISLLNAVLKRSAERRIVSVTLRNPFNLQEFRDDKLSVVDVRATDASGETFIIEMQIHDHPAMPQRHLFYWSETYCQALGAAQDYSQLKPVVVIAFLCRNRYPETAGYHQRFRIWNDSHDLPFTGDLEIHTIELAKLRTPPGPESEMLDRWSWFMTYAKGHEMGQFPPEMVGDPVFQQAFQELERISNDPEKREEYRRRLRNLRDYQTAIVSSYREGRANGRKKWRRKGREEGREEGREQGRVQGRTATLCETIRFHQRLLRSPESSDEQLRSMTSDELERLSTDLQRRLLESSSEAPTGDSDPQ